MKFVSFAALFATASAFTTSPAAFTTQSTNVGGSVNNIFADNSAHRTRKSTIVMDGKANGESTIDLKHHRYGRGTQIYIYAFNRRRESRTKHQF